MNRLRIFTILLCVLLWAASRAGADFASKDYEYRKALNPPPNAGPGYVQVTIDQQVYLHCRPDLADLRVASGEAAEVPYAKFTDSGSVTTVSRKVKLLDKADVKGQYNTVTLDLGSANMLSNRVTIYTPTENFIYRVEIEGSNTLAGWQMLKRDGYIFNFTHGSQANKTTVDYPTSTFRYLRVRIMHGAEKRLDISVAEADFERTIPPSEVLVYKGLGERTENREQQSTDITIDLKSGSQQLQRIVISSPETAYHRDVQIYGDDGKGVWHWLDSGHIVKYNIGGLNINEPSIPISQSGFRYLKLRIFNYDNRPIGISDIRVYAARQRLIFAYQPGTKYTLYYGNPEAASPTYDIQQLTDYISAEKHPRWVQLSPGPEEKNPQFHITIGSGRWMNRNQWVLWVVLIVAALILGGLTVRLIKQTRETPTE